MEKWLERTELLLGKKVLEQLKNTKILIVGLGGVGSFAAEFLARAGVGQFTLVDADVFDVTNINRQLPALHSTIGQSKAKVLAARLQDISPNIQLKVIEDFVTPEKIDLLLAEKYDYVLDCIDSITPKLHLLYTASQKKYTVFSSMGAGGKVDPSKIKIGFLSGTIQCKLARTIRKRLKKMDKNLDFKVVYSTEIVRESSLHLTDGTNFKKSFYGTISYLPAAFGLHLAAAVVQEIEKNTKVLS